jgi:hypothetical protein
MTLWVQDIEASVNSCDDWCTLASGAGQYSEIGETALTAYGAADINGLHNGYWALEGAANSANGYRVQFAVAAPVSYELSGFISVTTELVGEPGEADWQIYSSVDLRLDQVAGPLVHAQQASMYSWPDPNQPAGDSQTLAAAGQLTPGVYELEVAANVECAYMHLQTYGGPVELFTEASFVVDLAFTPAEPPPGCERADIDEDGDVDLIDFVRFQNCYTGP